MTRRSGIIAAVAFAAAVLVVEAVLPHVHAPGTQSGHWETPTPTLVLGLISGLTYGLLGVGLVIIYRSSRIINFAHGQIGAFASSLFGFVQQSAAALCGATVGWFLGHTAWPLAIGVAAMGCATLGLWLATYSIRRVAFKN